MIRRNERCKNLGHLSRAAPFIPGEQLDRDCLLVEYAIIALKLEGQLTMFCLVESVENGIVQSDPAIPYVDRLSRRYTIDCPFLGTAEGGLRS